VAANGTIANTLPYKLDFNADAEPEPGAPPARHRASRRRRSRGIAGCAADAARRRRPAAHRDRRQRPGRARRGHGQLVLAPFAEIPLQAFTLNAKNIDPGFFNPRCRRPT
jgi:translocation and assembly module TamB